ncbi:ABC transporter permease [Thermogemmatispora sp.]|uniref:ABC transporter permease n=1 Tax=Thermogemmatispora sp. TaxID=1968838 RepID=UPI001D4CE4AF|nr:ABC transporter permease [Thermogemmatispora sp.]MBX5448660.1 ABC transporter permease [Thermogemmatispora sp.]
MQLISCVFYLWLRQARQAWHHPIWIIFGLFQPLCYLLLFAPLLQNLSGISAMPAGEAMAVYVPGLLVMMAIFGAGYVGFGLVVELQSGFVERLLVTPIPRTALLLSRLLLDIMTLLIQVSLICLIALPLGLRVSPSGLLLALLLLALLGLGLAACSYSLALLLRSAEALSSLLNMVSVPLLLLSGIMLPLTLAPAPLQAIARFNPFAYVVDGARALFLGRLGEVAVWQGYLCAGLCTFLAFLWSLHSLKRTAI